MAKVQIVRALTLLSALMVYITITGISIGVPFAKVVCRAAFWCFMTRGFYRLEDRI